MIKNIIFDLGGVLIDWDPKNVFNKVFKDSNQVDLFIEHICTMEWNVQQDAGRSLRDATKVLQKKHPEWHNTIALYYGEWESMLNGPIQKTVDIFKSLRESNKYKIYALTNWSAETFPVALERYAFLQWFDGIVVSGEEKCIKPHPKIYNIILERFNLVAEECLFIDDNIDNINGAKNLGIKAQHFRSPEMLSQQLDMLGIG